MRFPFALFLGASVVLTAAVACTAFDAASEQSQAPPDTDAGRDASQGGEPDASRQPDATDDAGPCARDCGGAACEDGACAAIPVIDGVDALFGITADDTDVFYSRRMQAGSIGHVGPNGTVSERVTMLADPNDVVLVGDRLYFAVEGTTTVSYIDRDASAPFNVNTTVAPLRLSADRMGVAWLTASSVVWTSSAFKDLSSAALDHDAASPVLAIAVGVGKTWVVRGTEGGAHTLDIFGRPGPRTETIALPTTNVSGVSGGASRVFIAAKTGVMVVSAASAASVTTQLVTDTKLGGEPRDVYERDGVLYVVTDTGLVWRLGPDGTGLTLLARTSDCNGRRITVSPSWVYWTCASPSTSSIWKTPRP